MSANHNVLGAAGGMGAAGAPRPLLSLVFALRATARAAALRAVSALIAAAAILGAAFVSGAGAVCGELPAGAVRISGKVRLVRTDGGPPAAKIIGEHGGEYNIVLDEKGRSLARVMVGESVDIFAVAEEKGGAKWARVLDHVDPKVTAGHELWRRMRCGACVVLPATRNAAVPDDLRGAVPVAPARYWPYKRKFLAWAHDSKNLWIASDAEIIQVDLAEEKTVRSYGRKDGMPDGLVYRLVSDGKTLWIAHRGGVSALEVGCERITDLPRMNAAYAAIHADPASGNVWIVTDRGTFMARSPSEEPAAGPAIPTADRIASAVEKGIWIPHWERRTGHLLAHPVFVGERLYVCSWGDIYEYDGATWKKAVPGGAEPQAGAGRLWAVDAQGLIEYETASGKLEKHGLPEGLRGRCARLVLTPTAAWVAVEPEPAPEDAVPTGGGLARFDLASRKWQSWREIGGNKAEQVSALSFQQGNVWVVTMDGSYGKKSAHPGMTTTYQTTFVAASFRMHRFDEKTGKWASFPVEAKELETRMICGQDAMRDMDPIMLQYVEDLSVGPRRIFAAARLGTKRFFGGYWPCIEQMASRSSENAEWVARLEHRPEQLFLQGEQPMVLKISYGELTRIGSNLRHHLWEAVAHDMLLGLFVHDGRHWAVTESCVARFDDAAGTWKVLIGPDFRWYWRATAALDDGRSLYIGSDRGLVSRLDFDTGRFEFLGVFAGRTVARLAKDGGGNLLAACIPAPLGRLPVQIEDVLRPVLDFDAAKFDGKTWTPMAASEVPASQPSKWTFRQVEKKDHLDKSQGNFLWGVAPGDPAIKPRYYVKEVFFPLVLCEGDGGRRLWLSAFTGMARLDLPR